MFEEWRATAVEEGTSTAETVSVPGRPAQFAGQSGVRYTTRFEDPRDPDDDVAVLRLHGLYAHSEIEVTGNRLDGEGAVTHDTYFEPVSIPFEPFEENELTITCRQPRDRFGGLHDTEWVPDDAAVPGVWWDAAIESAPLPYVDSMDVRPRITEDGARLDVRTTVVTDGPLEDRITYSLKPEGDLTTRGMMDRGRVEADGPGKTTVEHTIDVHDPALWWPRELGDQNRYTLRAKLGDSERTVTTGICEVSFEDGFVVNGEQLSVRGVNLLTAAPEDVDRALDVNANLVRAHAHVLPPEVYEACDEAGLLVWQDLPLTGPGTFDVDRGRELAATLARTYCTHPSLAAYAVHDDPVDAFSDGLGTGLLDGLRLRWRAWRTDYDRSHAESVAEALPGERPVFPVVGGPGVGADAAAYYPGWDYAAGDGIDTLLDRYPADVVAEFGAGALAQTSVESAAGFDAAKHDRRVGDGPDASQAYQAKVVGTVAKRLRVRDVGTIAFALRDTDAAGMGIFGADGEQKAASEVLTTAFEPVQAFLTDPSPGTSDVLVVNDLPAAIDATVNWEVGDENGELEVAVDAAGRWRSDSISIPGSAETVALTLSIEEYKITNEYKIS